MERKRTRKKLFFFLTLEFHFIVETSFWKPENPLHLVPPIYLRHAESVSYLFPRIETRKKYGLAARPYSYTYFSLPAAPFIGTLFLSLIAYATHALYDQLQEEIAQRLIAEKQLDAARQEAEEANTYVEKVINAN